MNTTTLSLEILSSKQDFKEQLEECEDLISHKTWTLFAVACYRDTLNWIKNPDPRSIAGVNAAEAFVLGKISKEELEIAKSAAWSAPWAAVRSAESAAWSVDSAVRSAESAAWSASRSAESAARSAAESAESAAWSAIISRQRQILINLIKEEL